MAKASDEQPVVDEEPGYKDNLVYIYTSGTTGLPKAALFPNSRQVAFTFFFIRIKFIVAQNFPEYLI